jgi:hypothetical protein
MVDFLSLVTYHRRGGVRDGERTQRRRSGIVLVHLGARGGVATGICIVIVSVVWTGVLIGGVHLCLCAYSCCRHGRVGTR